MGSTTTGAAAVARRVVVVVIGLELVIGTCASIHGFVPRAPL